MDYTERNFRNAIYEAKLDPTKDDVYVSHLEQLLKEYIEKRDKSKNERS